jgi:hypothetical protein
MAGLRLVPDNVADLARHWFLQLREQLILNNLFQSCFRDSARVDATPDNDDGDVDLEAFLAGAYSVCAIIAHPLMPLRTPQTTHR